MKTTQSSGTRQIHQTVAPAFEFKSAGQAIAIKFTEQHLSPHAGTATFWGWLRPLDWVRRLTAVLPQSLPTSNNQLRTIEKVLAFMHGLLCDARKLTHVAYLRRDPLVPELLGIKRIASQSVLSRFFQGFASAGSNLRCFRPFWQWCVGRLPSRKDGYTLDLDSTCLLHEDGYQEGVAVGYTKQSLRILWSGLEMTRRAAAIFRSVGGRKDSSVPGVGNRLSRGRLHGDTCSVGIAARRGRSRREPCSSGRGFPFEVVAIREQPLTKAELKRMLAIQGGNLRKLFNTSGLDYRAMKLSERLPTMTEAKTLDLLAANGNLVKRPFVLAEQGGAVGFNEAEWRKWI